MKTKTGDKIIKEIAETLVEASEEFIAQIANVVLTCKVRYDENHHCFQQDDSPTEQSDFSVVEKLLEKAALDKNATGNEGLQNQLEMEWNYWLGVKHGLTRAYILPKE